MITVSLCMIVKNEADILRRCLDSYKGIYNELIIVDTGSTDSTKTIASEYTDKIYDFTWINDFSAARNFAFSKCSMEYIFSADADEVLTEENKTAFLNLKEILLPEIDIVQMKYVNIGHNMVYNSRKELRPKLFKRLREFTWISPIHETVRLTPIVFDSDIEIEHRPLTMHSKRDFTTFISAIDNNAVLENYVYDMFCKELFISGDDEDFLNAMPVLERLSANSDIKAESLRNINCVLARCYRISGDTDNFFKLALHEFAGSPSSEICMELGDYYYSKKDYNEAVIMYLNASSETESIMDIRSCGDKPLLALARTYAELALIEEENGNQDLSDIYNSNSMEYSRQAEEYELPEEI